MSIRFSTAVCAVVAAGVVTAFPFAASAAPAPAPTATPAAVVTDGAAPAVTHHSVIVGGRSIAYTATAGVITLHNADGDPTCEVFTVAYTEDGQPAGSRPVTFVWNGGPGSSSMWLQMGSYAPVRVAVPSDATAPRPGTPLGPNADSLIDITDLVFIDAPGTGYSRLVGKGTADMFYGIDEDARAFDDTIRGWTTKYERWSSPKFLFGESYGTTRAANVVNLLQNDGMAISGVVLLSSVLDYNALDNNQGPSEDLPYMNFVPTEAAVAWYHHKVPSNPPALAPFLDEVRAFALGPLGDALQAGDTLSPARKHAIAEKLHEYIGLDTAYIERANLRVDPSRFEHALLGDEGLSTGRLDGRYEGPEIDKTADSIQYDVTSDSALTDAFEGAFSGYVRSDLNYRVDRPYLGVAYDTVSAKWKFRRTRAVTAPNVADDLRQAIIKNPYLHVFSANGLFDLATPFAGTEYTLSHLDLAPSLRSHIEYGYYPSGHMVYLNDEARRALKADLVRFYAESQGR